MSIILNDKVERYVRKLAEDSQNESQIFPVDRMFLESRLAEIMSLDSLSFLYYNFELVNDTYVTQLFVCLPEVWTDVSLKDLIEMSDNFTNVQSYFTLLKFTYKYIEIDIIEIVLKKIKIRNYSYYEQVIEFLNNQWNLLLKSEVDFEDFEDGFIGVDLNVWKYIKQKFLIDNRVKPALLSPDDLKRFVDRLTNS